MGSVLNHRHELTQRRVVSIPATPGLGMVGGVKRPCTVPCVI